jgi:hypothetical protein
LKVELRGPADRVEVEEGAATRRNPKLRDRFRLVLAAIDGMEAPQIAATINTLTPFYAGVGVPLSRGRDCRLVRPASPGQRV